MGKAMIYTVLAVMLMSAVFYTLYTVGASSVGDNVGSNLNETESQFGGSQWLNGTETEFGVDVDVGSVLFSLEGGVYALVISSFTALIAGSIMVVGSGMGTSGVRAIGAIIFYYGLFWMFGYFALLALVPIPFGLGYLLWFMLTLVYSLGVYGEVA